MTQSILYVHKGGLLLTQSILYVHKGGLKHHSFHFILQMCWATAFFKSSLIEITLMNLKIIPVASLLETEHLYDSV